MILIRGLGPQFGETFISLKSEVNGARKVKPSAKVAISKNSDPVQNFFFRDG